MSPGPAPPPPPKRSAPSIQNNNSNNQSSQPDSKNNFLASIQKGVKLKKTTETNDRSAPQISSTSSQQTSSISQQIPKVAGAIQSASQPLQGLFAGGFPQLKKVPQNLKNNENSSLSSNNQKTETRPMSNANRQIQSASQQIQPTNRSAFQTKLQNEFEEKSSMNKRTQSSSNNLQESAYSHDDNSSKNPPCSNGKTQKEPTIIPQKLANIEASWKFNTQFVPKSTPSLSNSHKKYQSGAKEGLNQFCRTAIPVCKEIDNQKIITSSKERLQRFLQVAKNEEQFELCIEIKQLMKTIDNSQEPNEVSQLVNNIEKRLNI